MGLQWATKYCTNSKFYFFGDDDYLVNIDNLLVFLSNPSAYPVNYNNINIHDLISNNATSVQLQLNSLQTGIHQTICGFDKYLLFTKH